MELTLDSLVNYVLEKESKAFKRLVNYEKIFGENSFAASRARTNWKAYFEIVQEFDLLDKLIR